MLQKLFEKMFQKPFMVCKIRWTKEFPDVYYRKYSRKIFLHRSSRRECSSKCFRFFFNYTLKNPTRLGRKSILEDLLEHVPQTLQETFSISEKKMFQKKKKKERIFHKKLQDILKEYSKEWCEDNLSLYETNISENVPLNFEENFHRCLRKFFGIMF